LTNRWRAVWDKRELLKDVRGDPLEPELEQRLDADLLDLGTIWVDLCVRLAEPGKVNAAHEEALQILADTEVLFGASHVLCRQRQARRYCAGKAELAQAAAECVTTSPPRTAWGALRTGPIAASIGSAR